MENKYEEMSKETGWRVEDIKRGYAVFSTSHDTEVIQKLDDLDGTEFAKFETDTEAGEQALKDGLNVSKASEDDEELAGWYILNRGE